VNTIIGEAVFSMGPSRDYISIREQNQIKERMKMVRVLGGQGKSLAENDSELL
jgi:hypothetical protein